MIMILGDALKIGKDELEDSPTDVPSCKIRGILL
jgi:hypothetical protein